MIIPLILKIHAHGNVITEVPVTPDTTCRDIIECCRDPGEDYSSLIEIHHGSVRRVAEDEKPFDLLRGQKNHEREVLFYLRYSPVIPLRRKPSGRNVKKKNGMKEPGSSSESLPDGVELTLSELQDMATRQQQQIESQQQMLVAKEQRLKFLKQQEMHHNQTSADSERLRRLRDRVEAQELKLRKLRALRGQVDQQKVNNTSLTSELESIRALFNEKEKELSIAVAKVEELTQQLEELRRGRLTNQLFGGNASTSVIELEKLRRELLYRNKLNEQQNNKLVQQREALTRGQEEMNRIDRRIAELQQRLHKKRLLNQELANQINAATTAKQSQLRISKTRNRLRPLSANIAAVEPFKHTPQELPIVAPNAQPERSQDDLHPKLNVIISEDLPEFQPNKKDPKYQTLPVNTKFSAKFNNKVESQIPEEIKSENARHESTSSLVKLDDKSNIIPGQTTNNIPNGKIPSTQTVHSIPAYTPPKSHAMPLAHQTHPQQQMTALPLNHNKQTLVNLAPKPYGSTYTSSLLGSMMSITNRNQPLGNNGSIPSSNSSPKYIPPPAPPPPISSVISPPPPPPPPPVTTTIAITTSSSLPSSTSLTSSFRSTVSLPNTPLTTAVAEKPVTSVQPTTLQQSKSVGGLQSRPSTIYQTSSTRITPVTPHTLSTTPQGILREVENAVGNANNNGANGLPFFKSNSIMATKSNTGSTNFNSETTNTTIATTTISSASTSDLNSAVQNMSSLNETQEQIVNNANLESSANKPSLPPKPSIPQKPTPPPRQIHSSSGEKLKVDTSPDAVDSALNILRGSQLAKANGNYRYASRNTIADTYTQKVGNSLNQYLSNVSHYTRNDNDSEQIPNENNPGNLAPPNEEVEVDNSSRKPSVNDLPIKAKPLTIKKHSGVDPPKLKASSNGNVGTGLHKRPSPPLDNNTSTTNVNNSASSNNANISTVNNDNKIHSHNNIGRNNRVATNVHISINRRIEMPPAFLFPENEAPPPDLNGGNRESSSSNSSAANTDSKNDISNDNVAKIPPPPPPPLAPPPYPGTKSESTWDPNKTLSDICKRSVGDNFVTEDTALIENSGSDKLRTESDQIHENSSHYSSSEVAEDISDNMPIETSVSIVIQESNDPEGDSSGSSNESQSNSALGMVRRAQKGNLKTKGSSKTVRRVSFDPLALLLDASLEGELELVKKTAREVPNPSAANDEGITALHNAICAGHFEIVKFLVEFGCDVNAQDSDGWTPLHCAASCNNLPMVKFLVEHGACIFATTLSDHETAAEKCEEDEEGFDGCSEYLYSIQEKLGILNNGAVYALYEYEAKNSDEVSFKDGEMIIVLRKGDEFEREWWWSRIKNKEGYIPRNLLGLYPRVIPSKQQ